MSSVGKWLGFLVLLAAVGDILLHEGWYSLPERNELNEDEQMNNDATHIVSSNEKELADARPAKSSAPPSSSSQQQTSSSTLSEFCSCSAEDVNENSAPLLRLLNRIVRRPFYRYYKVNTERACPFWAVELLCTSADSPCTLCTCDAKDVPVDVRAEQGDMSDVTFGNSNNNNNNSEDDEAIGLAETVERRRGQQQKQPQKDHSEEQVNGDVTHGHTPADVHLWGAAAPYAATSSVLSSASERPTSSTPLDVVASDADGSETDETDFVDLVLNPEGNTGYTGPMANRVWEAIYRENCLRDVADQLATAASSSAAETLSAKQAWKEEEVEKRVPRVDPSQCSELQVFFKLMSGFHASIGVNVAVNFHRIGYEDEDEGNGADERPIRSAGSDKKGISDSGGGGEDNGKQAALEKETEKTAATETNQAKTRNHRIPVYAPNCGMLKRMRSFHDRLENLRFLYQFVLRAVAKSSDSFLGTVASTSTSGDRGGGAQPSRKSSSEQEREATLRIHRSDNSAEDAALTDDLHLLFREKLLCSSTFDEVKFLQSPYAQFLLPQMRRMMKNVSLLMDCVACQKCRLWGKLEAQGIATALKAVMSTVSTARASEFSAAGAAATQDDALKSSSCKDNTAGVKTKTETPTARQATGELQHQPLRLRRGEMVSLMNLLRQLSLAVWSVQNLCLDA